MPMNCDTKSSNNALCGLSELLRVTPREKQTIYQQYSTDDDDMARHVQSVRTWIRQNAHLPHEFIDDNRIRILLVNCKMSLERTKEALEGYYYLRSVYRDFFKMLVPNCEAYNKAKKFVSSVALPQLGQHQERIFFIRIDDEAAEAEDGLYYHIISLMMAELMFSRDLFLRISLIIDMQHYNWKLMYKVANTTNNYLLVRCLREMKLRVLQAHIINAPPYVDWIMAVAKELLPAHLISKTQIHKDLDSLYEHVPRDILPSDYGGSLDRNLKEIYNDWLHELEANGQFFRTLAEMPAADVNQFRQRCAEPPTMDIGSFRQLGID